MHCAILSKYTEESGRLVEYLVDNMPHCLEIKSDDEYTPLGIAFYTHKFEFAKTLISAGANQTVRAFEGKNLMHLTIVPSLWPKFMRLDDMLSLIDPLLIPSMFVERCASQPGSLTPLALWMTKCQSWDGDSRAQLLKTILDLAEPTGQRHLELLDGSGNTVLHNAVNALDGVALKIFLERRPDLLHRENAVGATPAELAENKWIAKMTDGPPELPSRWNDDNWRYYGRRKDLSSLRVVHKAPNEFVEKQSKRTNWVERDIYNLCKPKVQEEKSTKRKLVNLFDANEVAKRLAVGDRSSAHGRRYRRRYDNGDEGEDERDEVAQWL